VWVPGHYEVTIQQVWVPGAVHQVWIAPVFSTQIGFRGIRFQVCVSPGRWKTVRDAGHYETRRERVWVDGRWC
jgi:hypothetical protein